MPRKVFVDRLLPTGDAAVLRELRTALAQAQRRHVLKLYPDVVIRIFDQLAAERSVVDGEQILAVTDNRSARGLSSSLPGMRGG